MAIPMSATRNPSTVYLWVTKTRKKATRWVQPVWWRRRRLWWLAVRPVVSVLSSLSSGFPGHGPVEGTWRQGVQARGQPESAVRSARLLRRAGLGLVHAGGCAAQREERWSARKVELRSPREAAVRGLLVASAAADRRTMSPEAWA